MGESNGKVANDCYACRCNPATGVDAMVCRFYITFVEENGLVGVVKMEVVDVMAHLLEGVAIVAWVEFFGDDVLVQSMAIMWEGEVMGESDLLDLPAVLIDGPLGEGEEDNFVCGVRGRAVVPAINGLLKAVGSAVWFGLHQGVVDTLCDVGVEVFPPMVVSKESIQVLNG
eukprot:13066611-Ditylum_brightwellii.AAC.1